MQPHARRGLWLLLSMGALACGTDLGGSAVEDAATDNPAIDGPSADAGSDGRVGSDGGFTDSPTRDAPNALDAPADAFDATAEAPATDSTSPEANSDAAPMQVLSVGLGDRFTCAVKSPGTLWCWGLNDGHQLGLGSDTTDKNTPTQVTPDTNWAKVVAGLGYACATRQDHTLWCWGQNDAGQLGTNDTNPRPTPTQVGTDTDWADVGAGVRFACGIKTDKSLYCWGENSYGQLGLGDTNGRLMPVQVAPGTVWLTMGLGMFHVCAVQSGQSLFCWGWNTSGELGTTSDPTPCQQPNYVCRRSPTQVGSGSWHQTQTAPFHSCAVDSLLEMWCWGLNDSYELGLSDTMNRPTPTQVGTATNWSQVYPDEVGASATRTDGTLWGWGYNAAGELGLGDTNLRTMPTQVGTETDWNEVVASKTLHTFCMNDHGVAGQWTCYHVCATKRDGSLACWGDNFHGQLGVGDNNPRLSPFPVTFP